MEEANKICHHCGEAIEKNDFFIAISARHNSSKWIKDIHLAFHMPCFTYIAGKRYAEALGGEIQDWIKESKIKRGVTPLPPRSKSRRPTDPNQLIDPNWLKLMRF